MKPVGRSRAGSTGRGWPRCRRPSTRSNPAGLSAGGKAARQRLRGRDRSLPLSAVSAVDPRRASELFGAVCRCPHSAPPLPNLRTDHPHSRLVVEMEAALKHALDLRARQRAGTLSPAGLATALEVWPRDCQATRLAGRSPGRFAAVRRFAAHLMTEWTALFTFPCRPQPVDAPNWRAKQAILPAVVTRKILWWQPLRAKRRRPVEARLGDPHGLPARPQPSRRARHPALSAHAGRRAHPPQPTVSHTRGIQLRHASSRFRPS